VPSGEKAIDEVKPGDLVLAFDETTGEIEAKMVMARLVHPMTSEPRLRVTLDTGVVIETTEGHRFYDAERLDWDEIKEFSVGDLLFDGQDARMIVDIERLDGAEPVDTFNLTVADHHTYFVGGVLVHNAKTNT
jgi:hypothetical protein